jgi:hypothetical protein
VRGLGCKISGSKWFRVLGSARCLRAVQGGRVRDLGLRA